ncbi:YqhA family protein, partial [Escherichia coli]
HPDQPEWLSHVNASVLKVKLAMAIIGISSIHLLKTFIATGALGGIPLCTPEQMNVAAANIGAAKCAMLTADGVLWQTIIHCVFILSAIGIAWTDKLMSGSHDKAAAH